MGRRWFVAAFSLPSCGFSLEAEASTRLTDPSLSERDVWIG